MTHIVSFRADCQTDVNRLTAQLQAAGKVFTLVVHPDQNGFPDCDVQMTLNNLTIDEVFEHMQHVEDGHIMYETLRALPLSENSLVRRTRNAKPTDWKDNRR